MIFFIISLAKGAINQNLSIYISANQNLLAQNVYLNCIKIKHLKIRSLDHN